MPYGGTRRKRRIPRWLVLVLTGIVLGAGGLLFLQKSYGPTRLTVEQSEQLHYDLNSANLDKQRLQSQLNQKTHSLEIANDQLADQTDKFRQAQTKIAALNKDINLFVDEMPPDPRGYSPGVRAADLVAGADTLNYQILIMQDKGKAADFKGQMLLEMRGRYSNGKHATVTSDPIPVELQRYVHVGGSVDLPEGFTPQRVKIIITDQGGKKQVATRTIIASHK
jgi:hypothetical protein